MKGAKHFRADQTHDESRGVSNRAALHFAAAIFPNAQTVDLDSRWLWAYRRELGSWAVLGFWTIHGLVGNYALPVPPGSKCLPWLSRQSRTERRRTRYTRPKSSITGP